MIMLACKPEDRFITGSYEWSFENKFHEQHFVTL